MNNNEPYIFISYAHEDREQVLSLVKALKLAGYRVWNYEIGMPWAKEWTTTLADFISSSSGCIAFLSDFYAHSVTCKKEVHFASEEGKEILPVYLDDISLPKDLRFDISIYQAVKLYEYENPTRAFVAELERQGLFAQCKQQYYSNTSTPDFSITLSDEDIKLMFILLIIFGISIVLFEVLKYIVAHPRETLYGAWILVIITFLLLFLVLLVAHYDKLRLNRPEKFVYCRNISGDDIKLTYKRNIIKSYDFSGWVNTSEIIISNGIINIEEGAFQGCSNLFNVTIPDSVTKIGNRAFQNCTALMKIELPPNLTIISRSMFYNCTSLTSITIPEGITEISDSAFSYCKSLNSVVIPDSVKKIGDNAFRNCPLLTSVSVPVNADIHPTAFDSGVQIIRREPSKNRTEE